MRTVTIPFPQFRALCRAIQGDVFDADATSEAVKLYEALEATPEWCSGAEPPTVDPSFVENMARGYVLNERAVLDKIEQVQSVETLRPIARNATNNALALSKALIERIDRAPRFPLSKPKEHDTPPPGFAPCTRPVVRIEIAARGKHETVISENKFTTFAEFKADPPRDRLEPWQPKTVAEVEAYHAKQDEVFPPRLDAAEREFAQRNGLLLHPIQAIRAAFLKSKETKQRLPLGPRTVDVKERDDAETRDVRELGERIGYGRTMQLCEQIWNEKEPKGSAHTCGPVSSLMVDCRCREKGEPAYKCDWCCGVGRVTERVRTEQDVSYGEKYAVSRDDWEMVLDIAKYWVDEITSTSDGGLYDQEARRDLERIAEIRAKHD